MEIPTGDPYFLRNSPVEAPYFLSSVFSYAVLWVYSSGPGSGSSLGHFWAPPGAPVHPGRSRTRQTEAGGKNKNCYTPIALYKKPQGTGEGTLIFLGKSLFYSLTGRPTDPILCTVKATILGHILAPFGVKLVGF